MPQADPLPAPRAERAVDTGSAANGLLVDRLADWLMSQALTEDTVENLFVGCCERLLASDIPLGRAHLGYQTLHPLFRSVGLIWRPGEPLNTDEYPHGPRGIGAFRRGPHHYLIRTGLPMLRRRLDDGDPSADFPVVRQLRSEGFTDYLAWFIPFADVRGMDPERADGLIGSWATRRRGGFSDAELRALERIQRRLAVACKVTIQHQVTDNVLEAYLGPHAAARVRRGAIHRGAGEVIHAVLMFSDLRESTALSESMSLDAYLETLNGYFECIADAVMDHGGEVLRFIGDAMLGIFPMDTHRVADPRSCPVHRAACTAALAAVEDARARLEALNARRVEGGRAALGYGMSLHVGDVLFGNIGAARRIEFSVVGPAANRAARIESLCKQLDQPLLVSQEFADIVPGGWAPMGMHRLAGIGQPQAIYAPIAAGPGVDSAGSLARGRRQPGGELREGDEHEHHHHHDREHR